MVTAAAIGAVGAIGGAVIGSKSAEKAAKTGAKAQEAAAETVSAAAERARKDVLSFFPEAQRNLLVGAQGALDIFQAGIPRAQQQLQAGNIQAQETTARGFVQQQAALLGLPVEAFQAGAPIITGDEPPLLGQSITGKSRQLDLGGGESIGVPTFRGTSRFSPTSGFAQPEETTPAPTPASARTTSQLGVGVPFGGGLRAKSKRRSTSFGRKGKTKQKLAQSNR